MIANNEKPRWFFYPGWLVVQVTALVLAWFISWGIISVITDIVGDRIQLFGQSRITEDALYMYILLPIIGLLMGIGQYVLLRRYLPRMAGWIAATFIGWLLIFVVGFLITVFNPSNDSTVLIMLGMGLIGILIALPQWWMLRQRVHHAFWWIIAHGVGWGLVGLLNYTTQQPFVVLFVIALTPTIATGIACWLLLDWFPKHDIRGSLVSE